MARGIHTRPNQGQTSEWITPPHIIQSLGRFDVDPCAHPSQFYATADRMIAPPEDGLTEPWEGRVFLNPPYGGVLRQWLAKMAAHGNGVALVPSRTEVESWFWPFIWESADAVLFLRGRLYFLRPDGTRSGNAGHGSVLAAYGRKNAAALFGSLIPGRFVRLKKL